MCVFVSQFVSLLASKHFEFFHIYFCFQASNLVFFFSFVKDLFAQNQFTNVSTINIGYYPLSYGIEILVSFGPRISCKLWSFSLISWNKNSKDLSSTDCFRVPILISFIKTLDDISSLILPHCLLAHFIRQTARNIIIARSHPQSIP